MRIGLMGGTFDPIHMGHLITASEIMDRMRLDKVIFIPSSTPPHKKGAENMIAHRMRMAMMAVCFNPSFEVSDYEVKKGGVSYTLDTIRHMKKSVDCPTDFFFIVGADAFYDLADWKGTPEQFGECSFVVAARGSCSLDKETCFLKSNVAARFPEYSFKAETAQTAGAYEKVVIENTGNSIFFCPTIRVDISSTHIRESVSSGLSISYLLPDSVRDYIKQEGLYLE